MKLPAAAQPTQALLGTGYDSKREAFVGLGLVVDSIEEIGPTAANVSMERISSNSAVADSLGFSAEVRVRYLMMEGSLAGSFAKSAIETAFSDVVVLRTTIYHGNQIARARGTPEGLTPGGKLARESLRFEESCGHQVVSQLEFGSSLYIAIKIEYTNKEIKEKIGGELKGSINLGIVSGEVKAKLDLDKKNVSSLGSITVSAFQQGGNVAALSRVFDVGEVNVGEAKVSALASADLGNAVAVANIIDRAIKYISQDFPKQLEEGHKPAVLTYIISPWSDFAIFSEPPVFVAALMDLRREVNRYFDEHLQWTLRVDELLSDRVILSARQRQKLIKLKDDLAFDRALIFHAAEACYDRASEASDVMADLRSRLRVKDLEPDIFNVHLEEFAQWYAVKDAPITLKVDKKVIEAIVDQAKNFFVDFDAIPTARERGLALQNFIETRADAVVWDLSNKELTDIRPLSTLTELKMLNIARNSLVDISLLKNLRKLLKLDISSQKNKINSLAPLEEMIQLQDLNCRANAIHDLSPLVKCNDLRELNISHNNITDISPLLNLAKLENLTLSSNPIKNITKLAEHPLLNNLFFTKNSLEIEIIVHPIGNSSNPASFYPKQLRLNLTRQEDSNLFLGIYNNKLGVNFQGTVGFYGFQRQLGKCWVLLDISSILSIAESSIKIMITEPFISVPISEDGQSIIGPAHLIGMNLVINN